MKANLMVQAETFLKTRQVADALGVSVSTIKRWVDSGAIEASRTMGKHRLVPLSSVLQFARRENLPVDGLIASGVDDKTASENLTDQLLEALKLGFDRDASRLVLMSYETGNGICELADNLIRPVMERIGHGWLLGQWEIYEEHQATQSITSALSSLNQKLIESQVAPRPLALGGAPQGDPYTLPTLLGEIALREVGWDVKNLGNDLPLRSFASAVRNYHPGLVFVSASLIASRDAFVNEYSYLYEAANQVGAAIVLGGRALDADLRSRLIFASFGDRIAHLAEFARRMLPQSSLPDHQRRG